MHLPTVALVGNPNTGKTTLFNALAGMKQRVGNYPGVTVEIKKGKLHYQGQTFEVLDLPGTYSLAPRSPDEMVAVELILGHCPGEDKPDVVVTILDASNLERNLYLMTQVRELGVPVVVALNMIDVADHQGIRIDATELSRRLSVPVIPMQAHKGIGVEELKQAIGQSMAVPPSNHGPAFPEAFLQEESALGRLVGQEIPPYLVRRCLLDVGGYTERLLGEKYGASVEQEVKEARQRLAQAGCPVPAVEARTRYAWIRTATNGCLQRPAQRPITWTDRLDRVLTHKVWGTLVFLALMYLVFQSLFSWARPLMDLISGGQDLLAELVKDGLEPGPLRSLLVDGIIKGVGSVVVFLPQIMILFFFIAILEDCGYMARAAFLMDKLMARCGLNGKAFIPLLSSVACAVPGIMAARVIENRRDRFATIVIAPLMSCSARLPVYSLLIGAFLGSASGYAAWVAPVTLFGLYCLGLVLAPLVAFGLKRTLLRGETPVFVMEMPLYKRPSLRLVLHRAGEAGWLFIRRAGTLILASMILVWALLYIPFTTPEGENYDLLVAGLEVKLKTLTEDKDSIDQELQEKKTQWGQLQDRQNAGAPQELAALTEGIASLQKRLAQAEEKIGNLEEELNQRQRDWKSQSILGQIGRAIAPAVAPLGWDWRIAMAALASFPAREVMVGTLGIIYSQGEGDAGDESFAARLGQTLREQTWDNDPSRPIFTVPVALSVLVFFALCCQCVSTLAVIKRETNSWIWPIFTFVYMTCLAYLGAMLVYQVGSWFV